MYPFFGALRELNPEEIVAISDLRMQEDVDALKKMGAFIIRIDRPFLAITDQHVSEANVPSVMGYDVIIINDGTIEELEYKIELEIKKINRLPYFVRYVLCNSLGEK